MVGDVQFIAVDVTVGDCHDTGIAIDGEAEFVLCHRHTTALTVDGLDAEVHQVGAVGCPFRIFWCDFQADGLARSLYAMTGDGFAGVIGDGFKTALCIRDAFPVYLIALLGVGLRVRLATETLAIEHELHFVGIGVSDDLLFWTGLPSG